jgi:hypothetical protein
MSALAIKRIREAIESEYPPGKVTIQTVDARAALASLEVAAARDESNTRAIAAEKAKTEVRGGARGFSGGHACRICSRMAGGASVCVAKPPHPPT